MGLIVKEKRIWRELCQVCRPTDVSFSVVGDKVLFLQEVWWCNCRLISQKRKSSSPWRSIQRWLRRKTGEICEALIDIFLCTYMIFNWQVHCHQKAIWSEAPVHRAYYALQTMQVDKICLWINKKIQLTRVLYWQSYGHPGCLVDSSCPSSALPITPTTFLTFFSI